MRGPHKGEGRKEAPEYRLAGQGAVCPLLVGCAAQFTPRGYFLQGERILKTSLLLPFPGVRVGPSQGRLTAMAARTS